MDPEGISGKIVVLGDNSTALGFKLAGVKTAYESQDDIQDKLESLLQDRSTSIIIVNEKLLMGLPKALVQRAEDSIDPVVVSIGDKSGEGRKSSNLNNLIKRAIGFDMLGE